MTTIEGWTMLLGVEVRWRRAIEVPNGHLDEHRNEQTDTTTVEVRGRVEGWTWTELWPLAAALAGQPVEVDIAGYGRVPVAECRFRPARSRWPRRWRTYEEMTREPASRPSKRRPAP